MDRLRDMASPRGATAPKNKYIYSTHCFRHIIFVKPFSVAKVTKQRQLCSILHTSFNLHYTLGYILPPPLKKVGLKDMLLQV